MSASRIRYATRQDSTPEDELQVLARVYAFLLERHEVKRGGSATAPEIDGTMIEGVPANERSIPEER